jgi:hypothetical protein
MTVKEAARAVSERDDRLLAERMEALEAANREVGYQQHLLKSPLSFNLHAIIAGQLTRRTHGSHHTTPQSCCSRWRGAGVC